jgi:DNA-binding NtrC family response regulator
MKTYREQFLEWEKRMLLDALHSSGGHQGKAAVLLGIHRNSLSRKLIECGVTDAEIKNTAVLRRKKWKIADFVHSSR